MTATYFKATHSNGTIHLRATNGTGTYKFAVVGPRPASDASFSSRRDLAQRELERRGYADYEVVPTVEIERAEYNALNNASKVKYAVTFRGKKFTHTHKAGLAPTTHAVGYYKAAHEVRVDIAPEHRILPWAQRHPEGFYTISNREAFHVLWFTQEDRALDRVKQYTEMGYEVELFTL